jgi:hypothetical protein
MDQVQGLFKGLRPALKQGRAELQAAASSLRGMIATLDALDSINGDILAAADDAELASALAAARPKVRDVAGYTETITGPVLDENGEPVLVSGYPLQSSETRIVRGFLDSMFTTEYADDPDGEEGDPLLGDDGQPVVEYLCIVDRLAALDTPELRAGIAAAKAMTGGGE